MIKSEKTVTFTSNGFATQGLAKDFISRMKRVPDNATGLNIHISHTPGDRPWESEQFTIKVSWDG